MLDLGELGLVDGLRYVSIDYYGRVLSGSIYEVQLGFEQH